jgi:hypothetical protein
MRRVELELILDEYSTRMSAAAQFCASFRTSRFRCCTDTCDPGAAEHSAVQRLALHNRSWLPTGTWRAKATPVRDLGGGEWSSAPMVGNSCANRALRDALLAGFASRGYAVADSSPDFAVAYYATTKDKLDIMHWDYGYNELELQKTITAIIAKFPRARRG